MPKVAFDSIVVQMPSPVQLSLPLPLRPVLVHTPVVVYVVDGNDVHMLVLQPPDMPGVAERDDLFRSVVEG